MTITYISYCATHDTWPEDGEPCWQCANKYIMPLQQGNEMLHAENALKLTQILDLEQLLYDARKFVMRDGSPCWCYEYEDSNTHSPICIKARQATEPFWKKPNDSH